MIYKILAEELPNGIAVLNDKEKQIVEYIYYRGMGEREFSRKFNIPLTTVFNRKMSAFKKLKNYFK